MVSQDGRWTFCCRLARNKPFTTAHACTAALVPTAAAAESRRLALQVYATPSALDQDPGAFHRIIFLFISPQALPSLRRCMHECSPWMSAWWHAGAQTWERGCHRKRVEYIVRAQGDKLGEPGAAKAFRSQLPRHNTYYSSDPPTRLDRLPRSLEVHNQHSAILPTNCANEVFGFFCSVPFGHGTAPSLQMS